MGGEREEEERCVLVICFGPAKTENEWEADGMTMPITHILFLLFLGFLSYTLETSTV